ncbi:cadherin-related family member 5 [Pempheris klunzingeri]|uniref:cadherin-related family member 5 n=1 Tax=Pempheris klunzingeri TaxID=3127111 RepID=UPI0039800E91
MAGIQPHFTVRTYFSLLFLILLQTSTDAQRFCTAPQSVDFAENNLVDAVVVTINVQPGIVLDFKPPPDNPDNPFRLMGHQLIAARVLDYENKPNHVAKIICTETATNRTEGLNIIVLVTNVNDNAPFFNQDIYYTSVDEMSPVGTSVGRFTATDLDMDQIYYTLTTPESDSFKLLTPTNPEILVNAHLEYDKVQTVQLILTAQNTPLVSADSKDLVTATTTIMVNILDVDNRPPWFQPCTEYVVGMTVVCQSTGYTGRVVLNEQETGVLPLKPGPLYAIDGDSGINEEIEYSFLRDAGGLFAISPSTGNITMLKPADVVETISLTVLAAQKRSSYQFATTTVTISVQMKSLHPPQFQRPQYEAVVTGVGTMAMDPKNKDKPLQIIATDDDYMATGGLNPHITYYVNGSSDFTIVDSYLFMVEDLPTSILSLQVVAVDSSNDESTTAELSVEVSSGLTTTTLPLSTTDSVATTSTGVSTTNSETTEAIVSTTKPSVSTHSSVSTSIPSTTSESIVSTTHSSLTTEASVSTTHTSLTSYGSVSTASTAQPVTKALGGYGLTEMAVLGGTLGALLLISLVVIGVLICRIQRGKADWRKIYETSMFRNSLGQGLDGQKEAIQYINDAFQNDEDEGSVGFGGPEGGSVMAAGDPWREAREFPLKEPIVTSSVALHGLLRDDNSQAGSDKVDSDKEVKPILTKERRVDEGYKSVWFKEDIDPNAKEEVLIIPDSRDDDSEEEDEEQSISTREENDDNNPQEKKQRVAFNEADLDSGLELKIEDPAEDSDSDEALTVDL